MRLHEPGSQLQSYLLAWLHRPASRFEGGGYQLGGWQWCLMRYQAGRGFEMYRMGMEGVAAGVVNPCWNKEKESKWGTIGWRVDKTGQPCGDVENQ